MEHTEPLEDLLNKSQRLNRALAVINHAYSVLLHSKTEQELYRKICESVTTQNGFPLAWIGVAVEGDMKAVDVFTSAGKASAYIEGIKVSWGDNPNGNGPAGRAFRTGKVQFFNNMGGLLPGLSGQRLTIFNLPFLCLSNSQREKL